MCEPTNRCCFQKVFILKTHEYVFVSVARRLNKREREWDSCSCGVVLYCIQTIMYNLTKFTPARPSNSKHARTNIYI